MYRILTCHPIGHRRFDTHAMALRAAELFDLLPCRVYLNLGKDV